MANGLCPKDRFHTHCGAEGLGEAHGEGVQTGFRCGVREGMPIWAFRSQTGDVHDRAAARRRPSASDDGRQTERSLDLHGSDLVEKFFGHGLRRGIHRRRAGVVDENVDPPELVRAGANEVVDLLPATDMACE